MGRVDFHSAHEIFKSRLPLNVLDASPVLDSSFVYNRQPISPTTFIGLPSTTEKGRSCDPYKWDIFLRSALWTKSSNAFFQRFDYVLKISMLSDRASKLLQASN